MLEEPIGRGQQEGHPHLQLGPLRSGQERHPGAAWRQGIRLASGIGKIRHQIPHHPGAAAPAGGQAAGGGSPHQGQLIIPTGPASHPLRIGEVAIAKAGGEQHGPKLIPSQKHHHSLARPDPLAAGPEQQPPKTLGRYHPLKQPPGAGHRMFLTGGVGAGHQHQMKGAGGIRPSGTEGELVVQALRQGAHPGGELAWAVADQHDGGGGGVNDLSGPGGHLGRNRG
jgi:hypothetical protein